MPRISTIPPEQAGGELAEAYRRVVDAGFPAVPTVFQVASLRADIVANLAEGYRVMFAAGRLPRTTKEAIATWVSVLNQCPYCTEAHALSLQVTGASPEQVAAAREGDAEAFSDDAAVRAFLPLAEKITRHAHRVTDEDVEALRRAGWDDEQILEAVHVAAAFNLMNRLADALGLSEDDLRGDLERMAQAAEPAA